MERRGVWAASDSSGRARSAMPPAARKQRLPEAEIDGAEVSWALPYRNARAASPRSARGWRGHSGGAGAAATEETSLRSSYSSSRKRCVASKRATAKRLGGRGEGVSLLHDISDENDALGVAGLATGMGPFRRLGGAIAFVVPPGALPLV